MQSARKAVDEGVKEAKSLAETANAEAQAKLQAAIAALETLQRQLDAEEYSINQQITTNKTKTQTREAQLRKEAAEAEARANAQERDARMREALETSRARATKIQRELQQKERLMGLEEERNSKRREAEARQSAVSAFGNCSDEYILRVREYIVAQAKGKTLLRSFLIIFPGTDKLEIASKSHMQQQLDRLDWLWDA